MFLGTLLQNQSREASHTDLAQDIRIDQLQISAVNQFNACFESEDETYDNDYAEQLPSPSGGLIKLLDKYSSSQKNNQAEDLAVENIVQQGYFHFPIKDKNKQDSRQQFLPQQSSKILPTKSLMFKCDQLNNLSRTLGVDQSQYEPNQQEDVIDLPALNPLDNRFRLKSVNSSQSPQKSLRMFLKNGFISNQVVEEEGINSFEVFDFEGLDQECRKSTEIVKWLDIERIESSGQNEVQKSVEIVKLDPEIENNTFIEQNAQIDAQDTEEAQTNFQQNQSTVLNSEDKIQDSSEKKIKRETYAKPINDLTIPDIKHFVLSPGPEGGMIQCTIRRDRRGLGKLYPRYTMFISKYFRFLMSAKKRAYNHTSNYSISLNRDIDLMKKNIIGKLRSDFLGTRYILFDEGVNPEKKIKLGEHIRQQLGVVIYQNRLGKALSPRSIKVILPKVEGTQAVKYQPTKNNEGILKDMNEEASDKLLVFVNRQPQWCSEFGGYTLDFFGRVDSPSVKNFQLIQLGGSDEIFLQFGKINDDEFNLDFKYPFSPLQAFEIALSSFDYKFACQ